MGDLDITLQGKILAPKWKINFDHCSVLPRALAGDLVTSGEPDRLVQRLRADVRVLASSIESKVKNDYSNGDTMWIGMGEGEERGKMAEPRCAIEQVALAIWEWHRGEWSGDVGGAEFWALALEDSSQDEVRLHWDKDYSLEDQVNVYPHVATVTYLSDVGAPTVFFDHKLGPLDAMPTERSCSSAFVSHPATGKTVAFDGTLLHGAMHELNVWQAASGSSSTSRGKRARRSPGPPRLTLLVNCWYGHRPAWADPMTSDMVDRMRLPPTAVAMAGTGADVAGRAAAATARLPSADLRRCTEDHEYRVANDAAGGRGRRKTMYKVPLPKAMPRVAAPGNPDTSTARLAWAGSRKPSFPRT